VKVFCQPDGGEGLAKCKGYRREAVSEGASSNRVSRWTKPNTRRKHRTSGQRTAKSISIKMRSVDSATVRGNSASIIWDVAFCFNFRCPCHLFGQVPSSRSNMRRALAVRSTTAIGQRKLKQKATSQIIEAEFPRTVAESTLRILMDMDFAVRCPLVRCLRLVFGFLSIDSRVCSMLLQTPPRGGSPCTLLALHLHQVGQKTFTSKLLSMPSTQRTRLPRESAGGAVGRLRLPQ